MVSGQEGIIPGQHGEVPLKCLHNVLWATCPMFLKEDHKVEMYFWGWEGREKELKCCSLLNARQPVFGQQIQNH